MAGAGYCFECWPGGPVTPPPCRRCGSKVGYWTAGLCTRCHPRAPQTVDSCRDCHAWGATRTHKWLCKSCDGWRRKYAVGDCPICGRAVPLHRDGGCRLCRAQRSLVMREVGRSSLTHLAHANRHGQQLFFADMFRAARVASAPARGAETIVRAPIRPAAERQLVLFHVAWDLEVGLRRGFPAPRDGALAAALWSFVRDHARRHGWPVGQTERVQRGVRVLLGIQDSPGAPIRASDVALLSSIGLPARTVADVLDQAGMLEDDRVPALVHWFEAKVADLPADIRAELGVWLEVRRHGSTTPPRFKPRAESTIRSQLGFAMPALREWAQTRSSLREVARDDVYAALPAGGSARSTMLQGLRSIFRVLKARQLVFVNPTTHISVPAPNRPAPKPVNLDALRDALDSDDATRAVLAALLAFHAIGVGRLIAIQLTDVRDGRLHVGDQVVLLADPVRERLDAYLGHRSDRWPDTANAHLFVNYRNAGGTRPVTPWWVRKRLGMSPLAVRQDRILDEAHASGGDVRLVCDLFGLSVAGAYRYTAGSSIH